MRTSDKRKHKTRSRRRRTTTAPQGTTGRLSHAETLALALFLQSRRVGKPIRSRARSPQ